MSSSLTNSKSLSRPLRYLGVALIAAGLSLPSAAAPPPTTAAAAGAATAPPLRVCADPHNLPFSNARGEGFENYIATLVARSLRRPLVYVWRRQDGDFVRATLGAGECDVLLGLPSPATAVETTRPYYWSSYVLISRADRHLDIVSLNDHRLRRLRIGVEAIGGDTLFTPPARLLAEDGLMPNLIPYSGTSASLRTIAERQRDADLAASARVQLVRAVAERQIDVAAVWGPAAGYWVLHSRVPLRITAIADNSEFSSRKQHFGLQAMQYQIAMAVRSGNEPLRSALDQALLQNKARIDAVLQSFGIPLIDPGRLGRNAPEATGAGTAVPALGVATSPGS